MLARPGPPPSSPAEFNCLLEASHRRKGTVHAETIWAVRHGPATLVHSSRTPVFDVWWPREGWKGICVPAWGAGFFWSKGWYWRCRCWLRASRRLKAASADFSLHISRLLGLRISLQAMAIFMAVSCLSPVITHTYSKNPFQCISTLCSCPY